jgi:hypothetical protein
MDINLIGALGLPGFALFHGSRAFSYQAALFAIWRLHLANKPLSAGILQAA